MIKNVIFLILYEFRRFFKSFNSYLLLVTGTVPIIIFFTSTAEKYVVNKLIYDLNSLRSTFLVGYIFYTYIVILFFSIIVNGYLISSENAYEFLLLNISRFNLLLSKAIISFILTFILILENFISFLVVLYTYNITIVPIDAIINATWLLIFFSIFILSITLLSNVIAIRLNLSSSYANYLSIFVFFVIPFIIYFSYFELGLFDSKMLEFSLHTDIQNIIFYQILTTKNITDAAYSNSVNFVLEVSIASYVLSFILFMKSSITN